MLLRVPDFYHKFHCLADKCTDSCCIGWEIDVDETTLEKYRELASGKLTASQRHQEFAQEILQNIEDGHFRLLPGDRCPFLQQDGLCKLIRNLGCNGTDMGPDGENVLCDICREHPRFVEVYGDIMEKGVGLCCEEAVRLLLTGENSDFPTHLSKETPLARHCEECNDEAIHFIETEIEDEPDEMPEGAEEARNEILAERQRIFEILGDTSKPLNARLLDVLSFAENVGGMQDSATDQSSQGIPLNTSLRGDEGNACRQKSAAEAIQSILNSWVQILGQGESFGLAWDAAYKRMLAACNSANPNAVQPLFSDQDGARIIAYQIFRYYAKSLFDGDSLGKVQFAIFFWIMLRWFGHELSIDATVDTPTSEPAGGEPSVRKINAVKLLSKQTEYSEEIMDLLAENFYRNPEFSIEKFKTILKT